MRKALCVVVIVILIVGVTELISAENREKQFLILLNQAEISYLEGNVEETKDYLNQAQKILESSTSEQIQEEKIEEEWKLVKEWRGNSDKTTEPFLIQKDSWRIIWEAEGIFSISVYRVGKGLVENPVTAWEGGKDMNYLYQKGNFYLKITGSKWKIRIEESR